MATSPAPHTVMPPFSAGYAARTVGVNRWQMEKIIDCGLVRIAATTAGGHRRVNGADVLALAQRGSIGQPSPGDLAVHLAPLTVETNPAHQRSHVGWHAHAATQGLSAQAIEDAWAGLWKVNPAPHIGATLIGDVAGFVVAVATIVGHRRIAGRIRFVIAAATPQQIAKYRGKRFTAQPGDMIQRLHPRPAPTTSCAPANPPPTNASTTP